MGPFYLPAWLATSAFIHLLSTCICQTLSPVLRTKQCLSSGLHCATANKESKGRLQLKEVEVIDTSLREGLNLKRRELGTTSLQIGV